MAIDSSIYGNIKQYEAPDAMNSMAKAMNLRQMALQSDQQERKAAEDERNSKLAMIQKVQQISLPVMESLASLPEDQRASAYPQAMKDLASQGVPMNNVPHDAQGNAIYDPNHFKRSYDILKNSDFGLARQKTQAELASEKLDPEAQALNKQKTKAEIAKIYAEAGKAKNDKTPNQSQFAAATFGTRANQAENVFEDLAKNGFDATSRTSVLSKMLPDFVGGLKSEDVRRQDQAERNFVNAILRRESGAAISKSEFDNASEQYFPRAGDTPEVLKQKEQNRKTAIAALVAEGAPALSGIAKNMSQMSIGDSIPQAKKITPKPPKGMIHVRAPDGNIYEIPSSDKGKAIANGGSVVK